MPSKIEAELKDAADINTKRGESRNDFLIRCLAAITDLSDDEYEALSPEAKDWFNDAVEVQNKNVDTGGKAPIPDFPDAAPPPAPARAADDFRPGDRMRVTTKRGKVVEGECLEIGGDILVLQTEGGEEEFDPARLDKMERIDGDGGAAADDGPAGEPEIAEGSEVRVETSRGKVVEGKVIELTDEMIVVSTAGGEEEFVRERLKSVTLVGGTKPAASGRRAAAATPPPPAPAPASGRRAAATPPAPAAASGEDEKSRSSNPRGVSVGKRVRELVAEKMDITEAEIGKALTKEGIEFKDTSVKMIFKDCQQMLDALEANKRLK